METPPNDQSQPEPEQPANLSDPMPDSNPSVGAQPEPAATPYEPRQPQHYQPQPQPSTPTGTQGVYCTTCGQYNAAWRSVCERCGMALVKTEAARVPPPARSGYYASAPGYGDTGYRAPAYYPRERPGCLTVYAILMVLAAIGIVFLMFSVSGSSSSFRGASDLSGILILIAIGGAVYNFIAAYGIWNLKNWGRIMVLISLGLGIASNVLQICTGLSAAGNSSSFGQGTLIGAIIGIPLAGYVFYWFYNNGELFD